MRVLGIDCGTERTGYAVIESDGIAHRLTDAGVIATDARRPLPERLLTIAAGLRDVLKEYAPDCGAVEDVFHAVNARSALKLAHVRGVALLVLAEAGLPIGEYSPMEVKMSVVGYGRAEKAQVQMMVRSILSLERQLPEDASDAVAVAICHATRTSAALRVGAGQ
ncbi:MAG TPA: crossover junction endodeoxyribonuclease RuvC [Bryobacteraceae bacterium]|nr:crossover junction endodeoxyribonuclease RuvC [Bryobacteraceae bacterium]